MALGVPLYPTAIDTAAALGPTSGIVPGTTPLGATGANQGNQLGITNNLIAQLIALETVVGIPGSAVVASHDYRLHKEQWKIWDAANDFSPGALAPVFGVQNNRRHLAFPVGSTTTVYYTGVVPYGSILTGGIVARLKWKAIAATTGNAVWNVAIERLTTSEVSDSFDTPVQTITACSPTISTLVESAITVTTVDSMVAGDGYILMVQRLGSSGSNTLSVDACLRLVSIESV